MWIKSILLFFVVVAAFTSCSQNSGHEVDLVKYVNDSTQYKSSGNLDINTLHTFVAVNTAMSIANHNLDGKNKKALAVFDKKVKGNPKIKPFYEKALQTDSLAQNLCKQIDSIRALLIAKALNLEWEIAKKIGISDFRRTQNYNITDSIMIGSNVETDNGERGKAHELKMQLADYRKKILSFIFTEDTTAVDVGLRTPDYFDKIISEKVNWEYWNFDKMPLLGIVIILAETKNDVKSAELSVIQQLLLY